MVSIPGLWECTGLAGEGDVTAEVMKMSALSEEGVMNVRSTACDRLLATRVDLKLKVILHVPLSEHPALLERPGTLLTRWQKGIWRVESVHRSGSMQH